MLNSFRWFFGSGSPDEERVLAQFQSAIRHADARILEETAAHPELSGMGTTVTMAFHLGAQLCVIHVGDSRAYLYRDHELHQLTEDHTLVADMVRSGALRRDQVAEHQLRHTITNVVGGPELGVKVEARALEVRDGDRLLLCSDGLTEMVTNDAIAATLDAEPAPEAAAKKLLAQANDGEASDNITLIVVRFDAADSHTGEATRHTMNRTWAAVFFVYRPLAVHSVLMLEPCATTSKHTYQEDAPSFSLNKYLRDGHERRNGILLGATRAVRSTQSLKRELIDTGGTRCGEAEREGAVSRRSMMPGRAWTTDRRWDSGIDFDRPGHGDQGDRPRAGGKKLVVRGRSLRSASLLALSRTIPDRLDGSLL